MQRSPFRPGLLASLLGCTCGLVVPLAATTCSYAQDQVPAQLQGVTIAEQLGQALPLDQEFTDHRGKNVRLADFFDNNRPVLLSLNYYRCPMLCNLQLNALTKAIKALEWLPGKKFRMVTVSIDPRESAKLAAEKREAHLRQLGRGSVDWNFLVGSETSIAHLANAVGFRFKYDNASDQYAHSAALFFITADGRVARYLYGIDYSADELKFALVEASAGRLGSPLDKVILSCFRYDPTTGRYSTYAFGLMRIGGILTVLIMSLLWLRALHRSRRRPSAESVS